MWEWSNRQNHHGIALPSDGKDTSLLAAYDDILDIGIEPSAHPFRSAPHMIDRNDTLSIQDMKNLIERKLVEYKLDAFDIIQRPYDPQSWQEMNRFYAEFQHNRVMFLKLLAYSCTEDCLQAGMDEEDIKLLKMGLTPENFNTHLQVPFDFGGLTDFSNFCMMRTHPVHENLHKIFDLQLTNNFLKRQKMLFIPWYEGKIYNDKR